MEEGGGGGRLGGKKERGSKLKISISTRRVGKKGGDCGGVGGGGGLVSKGGHEGRRWGRGEYRRKKGTQKEGVGRSVLLKSSKKWKKREMESYRGLFWVAPAFATMLATL